MLRRRDEPRRRKETIREKMLTIVQCTPIILCNKCCNYDRAYFKRHDKSLTHRNYFVHRENPSKNSCEQKFGYTEHYGNHETTNLPTKGRPTQGMEPEALTRHQPDRLQGRREDPKEEQPKDVKMNLISTLYCIIYYYYCISLLSYFHTCSYFCIFDISKMYAHCRASIGDFVKVI